MDTIELTKKFIALAEARKQVEQLEAEITSAVLEIGETQKIAGIEAVYYRESIKIDHESAVHNAPESPEKTAEIIRNTTTKVTTAWAQVTKALKIDTSAYTSVDKPARVVIK